MKRFQALLLVVCLCLGMVFTLASCDFLLEKEDTRDERITAIYTSYVAASEEKGETPLSYDDWLASIQGKDGIDGKNGKDGVDGKDGKDGVDGKNGKDGVDGKDGVNGKDGKDGANGLSAYELAVLNGFAGTEEVWLDTLTTAVDDTLSKAGYAADAKAIGDAVKELAGKIAHAYVTKTVVKTETLVPVMHSGFCDEVGNARSNSPTQNYEYTDPIEVKTGDKVYAKNNVTGEIYSARFIIPFSGETVVSSLVVCPGSGTTEPFTVSAGVTSLVFTLYGWQKSNRVICIEREETVMELKEMDYSEEIQKLVGEKIQENLAVAMTGAVGGSAIVKKADTLAAGQSIELERNAVMNSKSLSFFADLSTLGAGKVRVGHGYTEYGAFYIEIDKTTVKIFSHYADDTLCGTYTHGLTVKDYLAVNIDVGDSNNAKITVATSGGMYQTNSAWEGRNGSPRCEAVGVDLKNVTLSWACSAYASGLYAVGDSYFNLGSDARWLYYLTKNGYTDNLYIGFSGMNSENGLRELKTALTHGTPKYVVWCLGMNDPDSSTAVNAAWLRCVKEVEKLCEERGITLILATIPNVPDRVNDFKNDWVIASGYRYIDFAQAVGAKEHGDNVWYDGMLYSDNVHPAKAGAQALYMRAITDCPELMQ